MSEKENYCKDCGSPAEIEMMNEHYCQSCYYCRGACCSGIIDSKEEDELYHKDP